MPALVSDRRPPWLKRLLARVYFVRGNVSGDRREYQLAVDDFSRALELQPDFVLAHYSRGVLYWRELENWHRAIRDLTRVIELAPKWHEAWLNRAIAYQHRGDLAEAVADLEHYLTVAQDAGWRANAESQLALIKSLAVEKAERRAHR
jgi:tetratricopeptide (TPR) repeat protein